MPKANIHCKMNEKLKEELERAIRKHPHLDGKMSEFINACATSFVMEMRAGRVPAYPLEFLPEPKK